MFFDAHEIPDGTVLETDVCIIGAGAAGITLAQEFIGAPFRVCLLESGGLKYEVTTQDLYKGENIGRDYYELEACRLRFFGGSTNHWEGFCRPLKSIDFEKRSWLPYSGWPFGLEELEPFYQRAQTVCQLGPYDYGASFLEAQTGKRILPFDAEQIETEVVQRSPPTRFGETYGPAIKTATNVRACFHANVLNIEVGDTPSEVSRLRIATLTGSRFWIRAKRYILATGGIENARLLLVSNERETAGLGNQADLVGRFFMDHPYPMVGRLLLADPEDERWAAYCTDYYGDKHLSANGILSPVRSILEQEQLLHCVIGFEAIPPGSEGWIALRRIFHKEDTYPKQIAADLWRVISGIEGIGEDAYQKLRHGSIPFSMFNIQCLGQQAPNPESRVTLGEKRDALGMPETKLDLRLSEIDKRSINRTVQLFVQELGKKGLGRAQINFHDWPPHFYYGNHHMGTTRMDADPKRGVVDSNCRIHNIKNLYIAGSSVFPTSGSANPTLTIVALALRLADHVKQSMSS